VKSFMCRCRIRRRSRLMAATAVITALLVLLPSAVLLAPPAARGQQATKAPRVGYLSDEYRSFGVASFEPLAQELRKLGYLDGRNIVFEHRYAEGKTEVLPVLAAELVRRKVDVIVTVGTSATRAAKNATETIPIVFTRIADPVALGLVTSLARPGRNLTGVSNLTRTLAAKWLELLAAHDVRAGHKPEDREHSGPDDSAICAAARGPSHTVGDRCDVYGISGNQAGVGLHAAADHGLALLAPERERSALRPGREPE